MRHLRSLFALTVVALAGALQAAPTIGQPAPDFTLTDTMGRTHKLSDYAGKVVVLEWTNDGCPYVTRHYSTKHMQGLQQTYTEKDVVWLQVCSSNKGEQGNHSAAGWEKIRQAQGHHSTALLLDEPGTVGRLYGAKTTPHMFVINTAGVLVYNGAIDSDPSNPATAQNYVAGALDALLAGRPVTKATSTPYGCGVKY